MRGVWVAVVAVLVAATACAGAEAGTGPDLPTFPVAPTSAAGVTGPADAGLLPDDCGRILPAADLVALLGRPLDSVAVRSTLGVPAPSVGRTERIDCAYTGSVGGPARGAPLLRLNSAVYTDAAAARKQWRTNAGVEDGARRELAIGAAEAVLVERPREALLMVVYGSGTLTVLLPTGPLPGDRLPGDVLVDMALRVLPVLAAVAPVTDPTPAVPATPPTTPVDDEAPRAAG